MTRIAVIGGGASGLMAAVTAAENGAEVLLLEHKDRVGKKLLSTGNGRCNFTNLKQEPVCYHSENLLFPWQIIEKFNAQQTIAFFLSWASILRTAMDICILILIRRPLYWMFCEWKQYGFMSTFRQRSTAGRFSL